MGHMAALPFRFLPADVALKAAIAGLRGSHRLAGFFYAEQLHGILLHRVLCTRGLLPRRKFSFCARWPTLSPARWPHQRRFSFPEKHKSRAITDGPHRRQRRIVFFHGSGYPRNGSVLPRAGRAFALVLMDPRPLQNL